MESEQDDFLPLLDLDATRPPPSLRFPNRSTDAKLLPQMIQIQCGWHLGENGKLQLFQPRIAVDGQCAINLRQGRPCDVSENWIVVQGPIAMNSLQAGKVQGFDLRIV
mmetsp:Transcript_24751/g.51465  ORF Transcript_24751/g.51465 Transcript_24751/m.51465 type:complete len:108 (+) Transcript_24751:67-390(+)